MNFVSSEGILEIFVRTPGDYTRKELVFDPIVVDEGIQSSFRKVEGSPIDPPILESRIDLARTYRWQRLKRHPLFYVNAKDLDINPPRQRDIQAKLEIDGYQIFRDLPEETLLTGPELFHLMRDRWGREVSFMRFSGKWYEKISAKVDKKSDQVIFFLYPLKGLDFLLPHLDSRLDRSCEINNKAKGVDGTVGIRIGLDSKFAGRELHYDLGPNNSLVETLNRSDTAGGTIGLGAEGNVFEIQPGDVLGMALEGNFNVRPFLHAAPVSIGNRIFLQYTPEKLNAVVVDSRDYKAD